MSPIVKFLIVTVISWFVGLSIGRVLYAGGFELWRAISLSYVVTLAVEAVFYRRYIRTQREFLVSKRPWTEFALIAIVEWITCTVAAVWATHRIIDPRNVEVIALAYGSATIVRYVLRKELMQDLRGLRRDLRREELM